MSIEDFVDGITIVERNPEKACFVGQRPESLVRAAEDRLDVIFPPTYRRFLLLLGAGNFGSAEFYGVVDNNFEESSIPDGIWCTLSERRQIKLPNELVVVANTGYGDLYCLDTATKPEGPIIVYQSHLRPDEQQRETVAEDFGKFFLDQIRSRV